MVNVKICGLTNKRDAKAALEFGADYLGFVVESSSPRSISCLQAGAIISYLSLPQAVAVTTKTGLSELEKIARETGADFLQIAGKTDSKTLSALKKSFKELMLIETIHVPKQSARQNFCRSGTESDFLLLDSFSGKELGGTGKIHDWDLSAELVKKTSKPVFLAGGLTPENVADAMQKVKPFAVDVSTGVSSDGVKKDFKKMKKFIEVVKNA